MSVALIGERGCRILAEAATQLRPNSAEIAERWRSQFQPHPALSGRAQLAIERLVLQADNEHVAGSGLDTYFEHVNYTARRLAKLRVPLSQVVEGLYLYTRAATPYLQCHFHSRVNEVVAAFDSFHHAVALAVGQAYDEVQRAAVETLLGVLDAELASVTLDDLLGRLLKLAVKAFSARWAAILLLDEGDVQRSPLRHSATHGLDPKLVFDDAPAGSFFRKLLLSRKPACLLDAANDPRVAQPYFRALEIKSVWAVPLVRKSPDGERVLGVLHIDFDRVYEYLPQELDLLTALAERSTLAIERAKLTESLRANERRVRELSRRLLRAQEEERGRISRDLHDETGQAMLVVRLYLEMAKRQIPPGNDNAPLDQALALVDRTVDGLRRIMARLSPLLLEELGLAAALRKEIRQFSQTYGIDARLVFRPARGRLPRELETVIYRAVQEGLNNVAKHANARQVHVFVTREDSAVEVRVQDDGTGMPASLMRVDSSHPSNGNGTHVPREHLGLAGMRERVQMVGGVLRVESSEGQGTCLVMQLPVIN